MTRLRWRDWPWAYKLAAPLVALALLPLFVVTIYSETAARRAFIAEGRERDLRQADNTGGLISRYVQDVLGEVTIVSEMPVTVRLLSGTAGASAEADLATAMGAIQRAKRIQLLQVLDHEGVVRASTDRGEIGRNRVAAPFFLSAIAGETRLQDPRFVPGEGFVAVHAAAPVREANGRIIGVAMARLTLQSIDGLVTADTNFGSLGEFGLLFDGQGIVISSPAKPALRLRPLAALPEMVRGRLIAEARYGPDTRSLLEPGANAATLLERARWRLYDRSGDPHVIEDIAGERLQVTSVPVAGTRWTYAVALPEENALAAIRAQSRRNLIVAATTALLALAIAGVFARWLETLERRVKERTVELEASNRAKDEFLGTISHELRTPLNAVLGWTQVLRRESPDSGHLARALDAIERNARAQAQLVEDLLDTSRVVSGKLRVELAPIHPEPLVRSAIESFGPLARAKGIELSGTSDPDLPLVLADGARVQQVVGNLISNAIKFTPAGGQISVSVRRVATSVEISVTDSGSGIDPAFLPYVFDRFRQADSTTTRAHGGLGLGLAIARDLVELHGGELRAESKGMNLGSTFTIALPIAAALAPAGHR